MVSRVLIVVGVVLGLASSAASSRADSPRLAEARSAIDNVRYDDARRLLVDAVNAGGNSPTALRQIYELSASTAVVLGQRELAEQYYRRWLALDPAAKLADGAAPKLQEAFVAAQSYMAAHGRLVVKAERRSPTEIEVIAESDPLAMANAAALEGTSPTTFADHRVRLTTEANVAARVVVLDDRGNQLAEIAVARFDPVARPIRDPIRRDPETTTSQSFIRRWTTWAVPSAACLIAGSVFGIVALTKQTTLEDSLDHSGEHFFRDVDDDHKSIRRNATLGIALGSAGALLAIPAAVFLVTGRTWTLGALSVVPRTDGLAIAGSF